MQLARSGYVDLLSVLGGVGKMFRLSTCSPCPAWQPGGCDGETGQRQFDTQPTKQRRASWLLAAGCCDAMRCLDRSGLAGWTELDPSCGG